MTVTSATRYALSDSAAQVAGPFVGGWRCTISGEPSTGVRPSDAACRAAAKLLIEAIERHRSRPPSSA